MPKQHLRKSKNNRFINLPVKASRKVQAPKQKKEIATVRQKKESPNIYRIITERFSILHVRVGKREIVILFLLLLMGGIVVVSADLLYVVSRAQIASSKTVTIGQKIQYWQGIAGKYPGYAGAYVQLATLSYSLGEKKASREYMHQALALDPNNEEMQKMEKEVLK